MAIRRRMAQEHGGVLVLVAIVLPLLLVLTAGGVTGFSLYAAHRELQRASDQAALAGAAAMPVADPNVLVENSPFPLPSTDPIYEVLSGNGVNLPRMGDLISDPRAVACAIGSDSLTGAESASLINAFGEPLLTPPIGDDGNPISTACSDLRVYPVLQPNPGSTDAVECANRLVEKVAQQAGSLNFDLLNQLLAPIQNTINGIVRMPLNRALPALLTPRMRVTTYSKIRPPLLSLITGGDSGTLHASATAYRRIKNAVVVPILPAQKLQIDLGLTNPITVMTNSVNLNTALHTAQKPLIDAIANADARLNSLMSSMGLPCNNLLYNLRQDLRDIYDPPTGPAPSAADIVEAAVKAAENTAAQTGIPVPDPSNPNSLAGEAFLLIGIAVTNSMQPLAATQIPILDMALVSMRRASGGDYTASVISAANATGAFRATLVE